MWSKNGRICGYNPHIIRIYKHIKRPIAHLYPWKLIKLHFSDLVKAFDEFQKLFQIALPSYRSPL